MVLMTMEKNLPKRSRMEIVKSIFDYVQNGETTPNQLIGVIGLNLARLNEYLKLIVYIQHLPPLEITRLGRNRLISVGKRGSNSKKGGKPSNAAPIFLPEAEAIPQFVGELGQAIKELKWKVSSTCLKDASTALFRYWSALNWTADPPPTYPEDTIKKIGRKLLPHSEELSEGEIGELEKAIDGCWDIFAP
jgi:predicted transcriptional regulator